MAKHKNWWKKNKEFINNVLAVMMLILFILSFVLIYFGMKDKNNYYLDACKTNCQKYNMTFLKSELMSAPGSLCFCTDSDGKPRQVPSIKLD